VAPPADDDEMTELVDADFPRVDLVGKGANGIPRFLIAKQDASAGLLEPGFVRDLIAKAEPNSGRERMQMPNGITLSGSPAEMAAFIHKASQRAESLTDGLKTSIAGVDRAMTDLAAGVTAQVAADISKARESGLTAEAMFEVAKAKYSAEDRKRMSGKEAMKDGSYPVADKADLSNAIHAVGRGGADHDAIRRHVIARAKALGASSEIPGNWAADGSLKEASVSKTEAVAKDMGPELDEGIDGMDPTVPLAEPDEMGAGDPTDPGSPAWESIDAATAQKWTSILARARVAVDLLSEREMLEAASADPDDACNAMDLQDVCCAIDYAIGVLAPFAVAEQSEADCGEADMMAMVGKSAGTDPAVFAQVAKAMGTDLSGPLQQLEYFGAVVAKSGRVLSSVNEAHIREAHARLNTVLSSLPQPIPDDGQAVAKEQEAAMTATATEPVAKDTASPEEQARNSDPVNAGGITGMGTPKGGDVQPLPGDAQTPGREVMKADDGGKPAQVAVYDADGNLVGVANPDDITPLANVKAPASDNPDPDGADAAPAPDPADMTPAPPAETGTPAGAVADDDNVAKSGELMLSASSHLISPDALESIIAKAVAAALGAQASAQDIAKQADVAGLSEQVETLKARLATVEEMPAAPKVFTNGAVPPAHQMRGQDQGAAQPVDVRKALDLKHEMYTADPGKAKQIHDDLQQMAIDQLASIHRR
jgi:hypothetical protein